MTSTFRTSMHESHPVSTSVATLDSGSLFAQLGPTIRSGLGAAATAFTNTAVPCGGALCRVCNACGSSEVEIATVSLLGFGLGLFTLLSTLLAAPTLVLEFSLFSPSLFPLQASGLAHIAALLGMIVLALLGSLLAIRDRLDDRSSLGHEYESQREEFMTDQERVHQLISENGGRMKQSRIVDSVDWSKAKVSRLLAELEEDGQITKLRLGRENLVCLPGHEPTASKSPEQSNE
nr:helix-turn-helix domain-containing protein [Natrialba chahannaoensis]